MPCILYFTYVWLQKSWVLEVRSVPMPKPKPDPN